MLFTRAKLMAGESVLTQSVGSGIGSAAVQLAKLAGGHVIGTASSDAKLEWAGELGMETGINYTNHEIVSEVMKATDGAAWTSPSSTWVGICSASRSSRLAKTGAWSSPVVTEARSFPSISSRSSERRSRSLARVRSPAKR